MTKTSSLSQPSVCLAELNAAEAEPASSKSTEFLLRPVVNRLAIADGSSEHLFSFAESLHAEESVWIEVYCAPDSTRSVALRAGASLIEPALAGGKCSRVSNPSLDLRQALTMSFPGVELDISEETTRYDPGLSQSVLLRGFPIHLSDLSGAVDPDLCPPSPRVEPTLKHVVLGAVASQVAMSDAIRFLRRAPGPSILRLTLRPRILKSHEIRELSKLYKSLSEARGFNFLTSVEVSRISDTSGLLAAWLSAKAGVELSVTVHCKETLSEALLSALSTSLSLPPSARRDSAQPIVDLSGCFVRGQIFPDLTVDEEICQYLVASRSPSVPASGIKVPAAIGVAALGSPVALDDRARSRHLVVCGSTGTGKSTLLKNMIASDVQSGHGVVLIDPHGDLFEDVLEILNRYPDVPAWIANTADLSAPYSLNLFQSSGDAFRQNFVCNQLIRLLKNSLYKNVPEGFGPMFEAYFRNAFLLLSDGCEGRHTISDMDRVFGDARFRKELLESCSNDHVRRFWKNIATRAGGEASLENIGPYIVSKIQQFVGNPVINPIVCARDSTIDFNYILNSGGVCIINLAKGKVGATEAEILGGILTTALFSAALERASLPREERRPVRVYLDEFQTYAGEVISEMLAECRKYALELTLATQSLNRLRVMNGDLAQSVLGNVGSIIALRSGPMDADLLADWIGGGVTREDITSLDDFRAIARFLENGRVTPPISFRLHDGLGQGTCHANQRRDRKMAPSSEAPF